MNKMETIIYCLGKTPIEHCLNCPHYMELNKSIESCRADRVAEANEIVKKYQKIQHIVRYDWGKGYQISETLNRIKEVMDED